MSRPKPNLLLSPELQLETTKTLERCIELAKERYPEHAEKFVMPDVRWDVKNTDGGLAYSGKTLLRFNLVLYVENREHFRVNVIPHEYAHLMASWVYGHTKVNPLGKVVRRRSHGKEWQECMTALGVEAKRCHPYDTTSIQKRKRSKRKSILNLNEAVILRKRLESAVKRLSGADKEDFQLWLESHINSEDDDE